MEQIKGLERQLEALKRKAAGSQAQRPDRTGPRREGRQVLAAKVENVDRDALRQMVDSLRQKLGSGVVVLASAEDGKVALITGVTKDLSQSFMRAKSSRNWPNWWVVPGAAVPIWPRLAVKTHPA